jgi:hypothetical protein
MEILGMIIYKQWFVKPFFDQDFDRNTPLWERMILIRTARPRYSRIVFSDAKRSPSFSCGR